MKNSTYLWESRKPNNKVFGKNWKKKGLDRQWSTDPVAENNPEIDGRLVLSRVWIFPYSTIHNSVYKCTTCNLLSTESYRTIVFQLKPYWTGRLCNSTHAWYNVIRKAYEWIINIAACDSPCTNFSIFITAGCLIKENVLVFGCQVLATYLMPYWIWYWFFFLVLALVVLQFQLWPLSTSKMW